MIACAQAPGYWVKTGTEAKVLLRPDNQNIHYHYCLAEVHAKGVLFHSIHLGNILVMENAEFGLIDVVDMSIQRRSLGLFKRARNFRHLLHNRRDREQLDRYGYERLLAGYEAAAGISGIRSRLLRTFIKRYALAMGDPG